MDNNLENQNNVQPVEPVVSTEPEVQTPVQPEVQGVNQGGNTNLINQAKNKNKQK